MSFSRKGRHLASNIKDLDYDQLSNAQVWIMADWVGARRQVTSFNSEKERRAELKLHIERDLAHAQIGYDVICRQRVPGIQPKAETDIEKRALEMVTAFVAAYEENLDNKAEAAVRKNVSDIVDKLRDAAMKAVAAAAERARPLAIVQDKKKKLVKGVLPPEFERMVKLASQRIPLMLVGPPGCGKTYLCEKLAEALDFEFSDQSCSEGMSESVFNGLLLPLGKNGAFEHVTSPFMDRYETGGVMLLDEIDAGDPNLFTYINKAIANSSYTVPQRHTKPVVRKHKDFVLAAAANTFGHGADSMYVGRNQLDAATLDRFKVGLIHMDYSRAVEESLAPTELCKWAWNIREKIAEKKLRRIMSTRVIRDLGLMTEAYEWGQPEWEHAYFAGWSENDRRQVVA